MIHSRIAPIKGKNRAKSKKHTLVQTAQTANKHGFTCVSPSLFCQEDSLVWLTDLRFLFCSLWFHYLSTVPEYDITHPVQVDASGRLLSRDLANGNGRRKREIGSSSKEPVYFKLSGFGQDFHVNVTLNHDLFSANFEIEIRSNNSSEFHNEIDHCHYIGQLLPAEGKRSRNKVALSNCDGLVRKYFSRLSRGKGDVYC